MIALHILYIYIYIQLPHFAALRHVLPQLALRCCCALPRVCSVLLRFAALHRALRCFAACNLTVAALAFRNQFASSRSARQSWEVSPASLRRGVAGAEAAAGLLRGVPPAHPQRNPAHPAVAHRDRPRPSTSLTELAKTTWRSSGRPSVWRSDAPIRPRQVVVRFGQLSFLLRPPAASPAVRRSTPARGWGQIWRATRQRLGTNLASDST